MRLFRKIVFWLHLVCGVIAGLVIGVMSFTGAVLAFEKEIIAFVERDARRVVPPAEGTRLPIDQLLQRVRTAQPDLRIGGVVVSKDPTVAIAIASGGRGEGGGGQIYVNPYTAEVREAHAEGTRAFMRSMRLWHRTLNLGGERNLLGRGITGACNAAFLGLAITGLYLWWPRSWTRAAVRAVTLFNLKASGKARDFNWHNVIGLWSAPILIVLTATALPMSYRWANNALFRLVGSEPPVQGQGGPGPGGGGPRGQGGQGQQVNAPASGAKVLPLEALVVATQQAHPQWDQISLRPPQAPDRANGSPDRAPAVSLTLKESDSWPRTATSTLTYDPFTGNLLKRESFSDLNAGRRVRSWTRFLHSGEALGWLGQAVAGLACVGGVMLMYTGFALSWRRFFVKNKPAAG